VLAVRGNHCLRFINDGGIVATNPSELVGERADEDWTALAAGEGSKGPRLYDWACLVIPWNCRQGWEHRLLVRRSRSDPRKLAYHLVFCPVGTDLAEVAGAAGLRWTIEECFQRARGDLGLDHCEARSWHGWHRHISLVMAAAAFLAAGGRVEDQGTRQTEQKESKSRNRRLALMTAQVPGVPELRYLIARLPLRPPGSRSFIMHWSLWRRKHQADAAKAHYKRRAGQAQL